MKKLSSWTDDRSEKSPSRRTCAQDCYVLKKSIELSRVLEPANLGSRSEHVTPRSLDYFFKVGFLLLTHIEGLCVIPRGCSLSKTDGTSKSILENTTGNGIRHSRVA